MKLLSNNSVNIEVNGKKTSDIEISCGVPQGGPLSPILFNIAIDFIYREICDPQFSNQYGFKLSDEMDAICLTGFADDQAVTSNSIEHASRIVDLTQDLFNEIGLKINPSKSLRILIKQGVLTGSTIKLIGGSSIECIDSSSKIKYLGCSYTSELIFDRAAILKLNQDLEKLNQSITQI